LSQEAGRANHIMLVAGQPGQGSISMTAFFLGWEGYAAARSTLHRRMLGELQSSNRGGNGSVSASRDREAVPGGSA